MRFIIHLNALLICSAFLYLKPTSCSAQEYLNTFHPLSTSQEIPEAVLEPTFQKINKAQMAAAKMNLKTASEKSNVNHFLNNSYYEIDYLLRSGQIIFNNEITTYLNQIADLVLKDEPELRQKVQIYLLKSTEVNAYATQQGYVFVSVGLLAQLETESQLAFIIAHEIQHIAGNHSIKYVLKESSNQKSAYQNKSESSSRSEHISSYSRKQESEADSIGIDRAIKAGYKAAGAINAMDVLQLSFIPFTDNKFNFELFETEHLKVPRWALRDSTRAIPYNTDISDDSESTHPNIQNRRKALVESTLNAEGGKNFIVSKETFEKTMHLCRFEIVFLHLVEGDYASSLYLSNVLLQKYPNNQFLEEAFAKSLYGAYAYKINDANSKANLNAKKHYSEMQRMSFFIKDTDDSQFGLIVFRELYEVEQKYKNPFMTAVLNDFIGLYQAKHKTNFKELLEKKNYSRTLVQKEMNIEHSALKTKIIQAKKKKNEELNSASAATPTNNSSDTTKNDDAISDSKYQSLRTNREEKTKDETLVINDNLEEIPDWLEHYSFMALEGINEKIMEARFDSIGKIYSEQLEGQEDWDKIFDNKQKKYERVGFRMGLDSLLIVDPWYLDLKLSRSEYTIKNIDIQQQKFTNLFEEELNRQNVYHQSLAWNLMKVEETDKFNDFAAMNDWFLEIKRHVNNNVNMLALTTDYHRSVLDKYHCKYVVFPGASKIKTSQGGLNGVFYLGGLAIFSPIIIPAIIPKIHSTHFSNTYFYYVYNLENGTMVWHNSSTIQGKQNIYDTSNYFKDLIYQTINYK
ncbi:MAG: hypothetical protein RLZZ155_212 [Bacteroidota bacterium]